MRKLAQEIIVALMVLAPPLAYAAPFAYFDTPGGNLLVVDTATNILAGTVAIGANPFAAAVNTAGTRVYATNFGGGSVSVIDTSTNSVIATIPVAAGPQGVALNPAGTRAYVASFNGSVVPVIDTGTNAVLTNIALPAAVDVIVNSTGTRLYVAAGSSVAVVDTSTNGILTTIPAGGPVIGMALTPDGAHLYVRDIQHAKVVVIDTASNSVVGSIPVATPFTANGLAFNPAGTRLYVSNGTVLSVIDPATNAVIDSVPLGTTAGAVNGVAVAPDGAHVYAATASGVLSIDTATNAIVTVLPNSVRALGHFIGPAAFATFVVTNNNDSGPGSLRDAIAQANASPGADTITFAVTGTIVFTSGQIQISEALFIVGPGAGNLTIDANANGRIFSIFLTDPACPALDGLDYLVSISGLRLTNARRTTSQGAGAIFTEHSLALDAMTLDNNMAGNGGGAYFSVQYPGQTLSITNSQFLNNIAKPLVASPTSADSGGALNIVEKCSTTRTTPVPVTIANSLFSGNRSQPVTLSGFGGAISTSSDADIAITDTRLVDNHVDVPSPAVAGQVYSGGALHGHARSLKFERSEIAQNTADLNGGVGTFNNAADLQTAAGAMAVLVLNSTLSGNAASPTNTPGAMTAFGNVALTIENSTITDNVAQSGFTGGIGINTGPTSPVTGSNAIPPSLTLISSIVAKSRGGNRDIAVNTANIPSIVINSTNSLVGVLCATCSLSGSGNLVGVDPLLGPLASNGGPSRTHALLAGSPAINAGSNPKALTTDQRGAGFPRVSGAAADMGAYEAVAMPVFASAVSRKVHGGAGTFDLPLSAVTTNPTTEPRIGPAQTIVFTFDKPVSAATVTITEGTATAGAPMFAGNNIVVDLIGVNNQQYVTVSLTNVASTDGGTGGIGSVRIGFLAGDVNQNRVVSLADVGLVNAQLAQPVTVANYLKDVNTSGTLSLADKGITNANLTKALPAP